MSKRKPAPGRKKRMHRPPRTTAVIRSSELNELAGTIGKIFGTAAWISGIFTKLQGQAKDPGPAEITEDAEFEIIEPKQLKPSNSQ